MAKFSVSLPGPAPQRNTVADVFSRVPNEVAPKPNGASMTLMVMACCGADKPESGSTADAVSVTFSDPRFVGSKVRSGSASSMCATVPVMSSVPPLPKLWVVTS